MRVLSWIFQPVYIIFFVIIAVLYIYRAEILPDHSDSGESRALIERVEKISNELNAEHSVINNESLASVETELVAQPLETVPESASQSTFTPQAELASEAAEIESVNETQTTVVDNLTQEPEAVADESNLFSTTSLPSLGEIWYAARKSAMSGDLDKAIADYIQLTSSFPQHADGFGELGNLYYARGDRERAIAAYQQALFIYQSLGASGEALQLEKIINRLASNSDTR